MSRAAVQSAMASLFLPSWRHDKHLLTHTHAGDGNLGKHKRAIVEQLGVHALVGRVHGDGLGNVTEARGTRGMCPQTCV
jgi:hypothetical protein